MDDLEIFGHRGAAGTHPENTMISFEEAVRVGADGIELDVHMSKDGELVVIHDEQVDRTTNGKGYVKDLTYAEIRTLDARYKFKANYGVCPVPSLREVLEWAAPLPVKVNIELKNNVFEYPHIETKVLDLIYRYSMNDKVIISSFNHNSLVRVISLDSTIETAPLYSLQLYEPWQYCKRLGAKGMHPSYRTVNEVTVKAAHDENLSVRPYTVNDVAVMKTLKEYGCDALITDYPEEGVKLLNNLS